MLRGQTITKLNDNFIYALRTIGGGLITLDTNKTSILGTIEYYLENDVFDTLILETWLNGEVQASELF